MENKRLKWFFGTLLLLVVSVIIAIVINNNKKEEYFNVIEIPTTHRIFNKTKYKYLDTIISSGLTILKAEPGIVTIQNLSEDVFSNDFLKEYEIEAYIIGGQTPMGSQYIIYIKNLSKKDAIRVISHELIHLIQYETGALQIYDGYAIWQNKIYLKNDISNILDREWERDAVKMGIMLEREIKSILINHKDDK